MITNIMQVYTIITHGEEIPMTEVRNDNGMPRIIRKTGYRYNGVTYKVTTDKSNPDGWRLALIPQ